MKLPTYLQSEGETEVQINMDKFSVTCDTEFEFTINIKKKTRIMHHPASHTPYIEPNHSKRAETAGSGAL